MNCSFGGPQIAARLKKYLNLKALDGPKSLMSSSRGLFGLLNINNIQFKMVASLVSKMLPHLDTLTCSPFLAKLSTSDLAKMQLELANDKDATENSSEACKINQITIEGITISCFKSLPEFKSHSKKQLKINIKKLINERTPKPCAVVLPTKSQPASEFSDHHQSSTQTGPDQQQSESSQQCQGVLTPVFLFTHHENEKYQNYVIIKDQVFKVCNGTQNMGSRKCWLNERQLAEFMNNLTLMDPEQEIVFK